MPISLHGYKPDMDIETALGRKPMSPREEAISVLRGERDRLGRDAEKIRLRMVTLNDLILNVAQGRVSAKEAMERVKC